jgi:glycosyltransferase involved in cell wall biosynthesis
MNLAPNSQADRARPRVGLNAHLLSLDENYRSAGVSRYIHNLLLHLPLVDEQLDYVAFLGPGHRQFAGWNQRPSRWRTDNPLARIAWEQLAQPWAGRRDRLQLLHAPVYVGPLLPPCPLVVTIHDLTFDLFPELFRRFNRLYLQQLTRQTVRRATQIIADSESTRADVLRILGVPPEKVVTIPAGVGEEMHPLDDPEPVRALRQRYELPDRMLLYLGTLEPRKNVLAVIEAYALLRQRPGFAHQLVIAGGKGWYYEEIYARVEQLGLRDAVIFPGYIPEAELPVWYNAADLFVYPSLYEGFGLPPLEAMACGTPVIVSNVSSLPEVVGEAGLTVPPHDVEALANAIQSLLDDPARRQALREAGLARAKLYSWKSTALQTAQLYHRILGD